MTDYAGFVQGVVQYPLPAPGSGVGGVGASLLRDADPAVFYILEFYKSILETHLGTRLLTEAGVGGVDVVTSVVAETLPLNPEPFLTEEHIRFPLLAAYRKSTKAGSIGGQKQAVDTFEVVYVLPPLQAGEAERLMPALKAAYDIVDNRTEQGMDPAYTPTMPTGTAGEHVWERAGVATAEVQGASFGGYVATNGLFFPSVMINLELKSVSSAALSDFENHGGENVNIDVVDPVQETVVEDFIEIQTWAPPTLASISPATGSKIGGTSVTLTGTGFRVGTLPTVTIGGIRATAVDVASVTSITCVTPAHDAFDTFEADVVVTNIDGQEATLEAGYTYTTP